MCAAWKRGSRMLAASLYHQQRGDERLLEWEDIKHQPSGDPHTSIHENGLEGLRLIRSIVASRLYCNYNIPISLQRLPSRMERVVRGLQSHTIR